MREEKAKFQWCGKCKDELLTKFEGEIGLCDKCWEKIPLDKRREMIKANLRQDGLLKADK